MNVLLDNNSDLVISKNTLQFTTDTITEIKQKVICKLRLMQGEWFLDLSKGVPYFTEVLKKNADLRVLSNIFKNVILSTNGVTELSAFAIDLNTTTRVLTINTTFKVDNNVVTLSEEM